jgi:sugar phosphate isomerase/epimerase
MYVFLHSQGYKGLEIAPTRVFPNPYDRTADAEKFAEDLKFRYNLAISSIQSIWRGVAENIFGTPEDRKKLIEYTKKAIDFAAAARCENIVFGCPKNRVMPSADFLPVAFDFFAETGAYAASRGTVIALEPNPPYYGTNFINATPEAFDFCRELNSSGVKVNVDIGTCVNYGESADFIEKNISLVNHIHISEPMLAPVKKRELHRRLKDLSYDRYFSIEMAAPGNLDLVKEIICYVKEALT